MVLVSSLLVKIKISHSFKLLLILVSLNIEIYEFNSFNQIWLSLFDISNIS